MTSCDMESLTLDTAIYEWHKDLSALAMDLRRLAVIVCAVSFPSLVSCDRSRAEVARHTATIRISAGVATGTFGPFSEALAKGYAELAPDLERELVGEGGDSHLAPEVIARPEPERRHPFSPRIPFAPSRRG